MVSPRMFVDIPLYGLYGNALICSSLSLRRFLLETKGRLGCFGCVHSEPLEPVGRLVALDREVCHEGLGRLGPPREM